MYLNYHSSLQLAHHFPYLSYVSGNLLQKMLKSCNKNPDKKVESLNKNLLLSPKCDINFAKDSIGFLSQVRAKIKQKLDDIDIKEPNKIRHNPVKLPPNKLSPFSLRVRSLRQKRHNNP